MGCDKRIPEAAVASNSNAALPAAAPARRGCDSGNGGITLPAGFCAAVFADNIGHARHLAVSPTGIVYANTWSSQYTGMSNTPGGFVVAMRDADGDGHAETIERFGTEYQRGESGGGTGIRVHGDWLYVEADGSIVRYGLSSGSLRPKTKPETILSGMPLDGDHPMHPFVIMPNDVMYVNSGSATNSCQVTNRTRESPGRMPCPELSIRAGIWSYAANIPLQVFSRDGRYATGARNSVALAEYGDALYAAIQGRDQLSDNWPKLYTDEQNSELPAEMLARVNEGDDFGWPYCYFDPVQSKYVLAPEYGGDGGKAEDHCFEKKRPDMSFPAHWSPVSLVFYTGSSFADHYHDGAFVAFHGSWNRKPRQAGYLVAFVPFIDGKPSGPYEGFATDFAGPHLPADPKEALYRPMGLAVSPDGALYVSDDTKGRIWRIIYIGN